MRLAHQYLIFGAVVVLAAAASCKSKPDTTTEETPATIKGLYTFEPGAKTFTPCGKSTQYWVADSSAQLEVQYGQIVNFEQQGTPVYIEIEGQTQPSAAGTEAAAFDSTLVVKKLLKITKDIPTDCK